MQRTAPSEGVPAHRVLTGQAPGLALEAHGLVRRFGTVTALANVSLTIGKGEFFSLLGPSGCGKTTLLRIIAGLDLPDSGSLKICGVDAADLPAHRRPVNTVFQSYALFPHLTVRENVAFGLRMKKVPPSQIAERVDRVLALVQIPELAARRPAQLSGGEKQRVALARALVNEPEVLLLDEPLGALDLKLRKQLQVELSQLQRRLGITFLYVTHDQEEALAMSDRIAVMNAGRIEQLDQAAALYEQPRTRFVAEFLGACNLIAAEVVSADAGGLAARTPLGELRVANGAADVSPRTCSSTRVSADSPRRLRRIGDKLTLAIRPEKVRLTPSDESGLENCVTARIEDLVYRGAETQCRLRAGGQLLQAVVLNVQSGRDDFRVGETVCCRLPEAALIVLDD